jgi:hypothetical protein
MQKMDQISDEIPEDELKQSLDMLTQLPINDQNPVFS